MKPEPVPKREPKKLIRESVKGTSAEDQQRAIFNRAQSSSDLPHCVVLCESVQSRSGSRHVEEVEARSQ